MIPSRKGYYVSTTNHKRWYYHSMSELAYMMLLDSSGLTWEKNTILKIKYTHRKKTRNYIPDFITEANIVEIKGDLKRHHRLVEAKSAACVEYCKTIGKEFKFISYDEIIKMIDWNLVKAQHRKNKKKT